MSLFGFLTCNKPPGMTSRDVVNVVQRRLRKSKTKVGHAGTLDPLAEGVLVLGVGPASRLVPFVQKYPKSYVGTFQLGVSSPSGDIETAMTSEQRPVTPTQEQLCEAASTLVGRIEQVPPAYSAIHVDGKRAYARARAGEDFEMPRRQVDVYRLDVVRYDYPEIQLDVECGSGTYIRTLGIDLAGSVGTVAVMSALCRTKIGPFDLARALSMQQLRESDLSELIQPASLGVGHLTSIEVDAENVTRLRHGLPISSELSTLPATWKLDGHTEAADDGEEFAAAISADGALQAIVRRKSDQWHPYRVFVTA